MDGRWDMEDEMGEGLRGEQAGGEEDQKRR